MLGSRWPGRGVGLVTRRHALAAVPAARCCPARRRDPSPARAARGPSLVMNGSFETGTLSNHGRFRRPAAPDRPAITGWTVGRRLRATTSGGTGTLPTACGRSTSTEARPARSARRSRRRRARATPSASSTRPTATAARRRPRQMWNGTRRHGRRSATRRRARPDMGWTAGQVTVTGTGSDTLSFVSLDPSSGAYGIVIDAVSDQPRRHVQPTLTTTPTPGPVALGTTLSDSATLTGTAVQPRAERSPSTPSRRQHLQQYAGLHQQRDGHRRRDVSPARRSSPRAGHLLLDGRLHGRLRRPEHCRRARRAGRVDRRVAGNARVDRERHRHDERPQRRHERDGAVLVQLQQPVQLRRERDLDVPHRSQRRAGQSCCRGRTQVCTPGSRSRSASTPSSRTAGRRRPSTNLVNAGPAICCTTPSNGFSYSGTPDAHRRAPATPMAS